MLISKETLLSVEQYINNLQDYIDERNDGTPQGEMKIRRAEAELEGAYTILEMIGIATEMNENGYIECSFI